MQTEQKRSWRPINHNIDDCSTNHSHRHVAWLLAVCIVTRESGNMPMLTVEASSTRSTVKLFPTIKQLTQNLKFTKIKRLVSPCPGEADSLSIHDTGSTRHWPASAGHGRHCSTLLTVHFDGERLQAAEPCRYSNRWMWLFKARKKNTKTTTNNWFELVV